MAKIYRHDIFETFRDEKSFKESQQKVLYPANHQFAISTEDTYKGKRANTTAVLKYFKNMAEYINKEDKRSHRSKSSERVVRHRCLYTIFLFTKDFSTLIKWGEYMTLRDAFGARNNRFSRYFDPRVSKNDRYPSMFVSCPGFQCDLAVGLTDNESFFRKGDAVVINLTPTEYRNSMIKSVDKLVDSLPPKVKIIFYGLESPNMMSHWDPTLKDVHYHYTMTYHSDSDVYYPYGRYVPGEPMDVIHINYAKNKTGLLVWVASNCKNTFWPRMAWVKRLQMLIPFDTYGACGNLTCKPHMSSKCIEQQAGYKFNLALENSPCNEYITEKFWVNSILNGVVPIAFGGTRVAYERVAPPRSFIHISDFSSQRELVDYLQLLDNNDELYNEYFAWRKEGRAEHLYPNLRPDAFCQMIPKLSESKLPPLKTIGDSAYFKECRGGSHLDFAEDSDITNWKP